MLVLLAVGKYKNRVASSRKIFMPSAKKIPTQKKSYTRKNVIPIQKQ
jgi:hypothetical protein